MSSESFSPSRLDLVIDSVMERQRRGERPPLQEYLAKYPDLADEIREIFPALAAMEECASRPGGSTGPAPGRRTDTKSIPEQLGEYRILREIARGGMGIVYEAVQEPLGRHVALKVLPPQSAENELFLERFRREAQSAARLHHTNIVPVFGVGEDQGVHFYAMQFIRGQTLSSVLLEIQKFRQALPLANSRSVELSQAAHSLLTGEFDRPGPQDAAQTARMSASEAAASQLLSQASHSRYHRNVAEMGVQIAEALAHAHGQGVIHRDIKPSNLMLDLAGTVWVTDFGLAKAEGSGELTQPGDILGTLRYMSPEQLSGEADSRSDVYSLGITLYELVALHPAFDDPIRARLIGRIQKEDPVPPSRFQPQLPRDLETILLTAIAREPSRRYQTAAALAEDLRRFLTDRPIQARRASWAEHVWRWCRRNRAVASLGLMLFLLLILATAASAVAAFVFKEKETRAEQAGEATRAQLWRAMLSEARARSLTRQPGHRFLALARIREALNIAEELGLSEEDRLEFRNAVIACLVLPDIETQRTWEALEGLANGWGCGFDFDARLDRYARSDMQGNVTVRRVSDNQVLAEVPGSGTKAHVSLSRDGKRLALITPAQPLDQLAIWDVSGPEPAALHRTSGGLGPLAIFDPAGTRAAYVRRGRGIEVVDLASGQAVLDAQPTAEYWTPMEFTPDGRLLALVAMEQGKWRVRVCNPATGATIQQHTVPAKPSGLAWHPSGERLAVGCDNRRICLLDMRSGEVLQTYEGHATLGINVRFDHTGDRLLSNDWGNRLRIWDVPTGAALLSFPTHGRILQVAATGDQLATQNDAQDGRLRLLRFAGASDVLRRVPGTQTGVITPAYWMPSSPLDGLVAASLVPAGGDWNALQGFVLFDAHTGLHRALAARCPQRPLRFEAGGALLTCGRDGLHRWPRRKGNAERDVIFGPPQRVSQAGGAAMANASASGDVTAIPDAGKVLVMQGEAQRVIDTPAEDCRCCAVSPDGKWVVATNYNASTKGANAWVYDSQTGDLVKELPSPGQCNAGFSPSGKWLWVSAGKARLWEVGTWTAGPEFDGLPVLFAPGEQFVAAGDPNGAIRLADPATGKELARLSLQDQERLSPKGFSADGSCLTLAAEDGRCTVIWDLRQTRAYLREMGLDWDQPSYQTPAANPLPSSRLEIDLGFWSLNLKAESLYREKKYTEAIEAWQKSLTALPNQPGVHYQIGLAYFLQARHAEALPHFSRVIVLEPGHAEARHRRSHCYAVDGNLKDALADVTEAIRLRPGEAAYCTLRASLLSRLGRLPEAVADWDRSLALRPDQFLLLAQVAELHLFGPPEIRNFSLVLGRAGQALNLAENRTSPANEGWISRALTLKGAACCRLGKHQESREALQRVGKKGSGTSTALTYYFLAIASFHLGDKDGASRSFQQARDWHGRQFRLTAEFEARCKALDAEVRMLLSVKHPE